MPIRTIQSQRDYERYLDFPEQVYRGNPHWRPMNPEFLLERISGTSPAASHTQVQPFLSEEDGRVVATVTAMVDDAYNRHWQERAGHIFFFEALPEQDAAVEALMAAAVSWLRGQGANFARNGYMPHWELPLTIDAYHQPPTIFHRYNPPYYHCYFKNVGFRTERGVVEYRVRFTPELRTRYEQMVQCASRAGHRLRSWDFSRPDEENALVTRLINETFSAHWGFGPLTTAEMAGIFKLGPMLPGQITGIAERDGEPVGVVLSLPDWNQGEHIDHGVLLVIGVLPSERGRGVNLALAAHSYLAMLDLGYKSASYTTVLDDNWPSRRTAEKLGCRVERNFVVYRKDFWTR